MTNSDNSFFITSTGTEVGKTLAAVLTVKSLLQSGDSVGYFKPVASGCEDGPWGYRSPDEELVIKHTNLSPDNVHSASRFDAPLSPDKAAERENKTVPVENVMEEYHDLLNEYETLVVEGIGGVAVPFNTKTDVSDLIRKMNLPALLVVSSKLGTISHTRTAVDYLRDRDCDLEGILLTPGTGEEIVTLNKNHLKEFFPSIRIDVIPEIKSLDKPTDHCMDVINEMIGEIN